MAPAVADHAIDLAIEAGLLEESQGFLQLTGAGRARTVPNGLVSMGTYVPTPVVPARRGAMDFRSIPSFFG